MNSYRIDIETIPTVYEMDVGLMGVSVAQDFAVDTAIQVIQGEAYEGTTRITPTDEEQVLQTAGLVVNENITVEAIPKNYGRISWDGSILTVS